MGVRSDGTVIAAGGNDEGQHNVGGWTYIVQVDAGAQWTVGFTSAGTVVLVGFGETGPMGLHDWGQCNVTDWTGITQVDAGWQHTVGLIRSDGTAIAVWRTG